jgi:hypothetical protein
VVALLWNHGEINDLNLTRLAIVLAANYEICICLRAALHVRRSAFTVLLPIAMPGAILANEIPR